VRGNIGDLAIPLLEISQRSGESEVLALPDHLLALKIKH
jgi:hypothetical protein